MGDILTTSLHASKLKKDIIHTVLLKLEGHTIYSVTPCLKGNNLKPLFQMTAQIKMIFTTGSRAIIFN